MNETPADPTLALVAADPRLNGLAVLTHAKPLVALVMVLLAAAILATVALWARALIARRDAGASSIAALGGISASAPLFGFFAAAYGLMDGCIGIANVRPIPSLSILAPGLAEAFLAIALGLLAAALATLARHHLNARQLAAPVADPARAASGDAPLARQAWPA